MNYHGRMINIPEKHYSPDDPSWLDPAEEHGYSVGHRDARHAAAEIANEVDRRIEAAEGMAHLLELLIQSEVIGGPVAKKAEKILAAWTAAKEGR